MFREIEDIAETLKRAKERGRTCSVLIGAGCSVTAGIPTAQGFVDFIKEKHPRSYERANPKTYPKCMAELSVDEQRSLIVDFVDKAKINWGHIALAQLIKTGYIDRILTTNFDSLIMRACALVNEFPAVYDIATSQLFEPDKVPDKAVFHLHGQRSGFILLNNEESLKEHSKNLGSIFEDVNRGRVWLVVGYSGENDPVFDHLVQMKRFDNNLFWIGYKDNEPANHVREHLLLKKEKYAFYTKGYDADSFFVTLAQRLGCFPPDFVGKPFSYLDELFNQLTEYTLPKTDSPIDALKNARSYVQEAIEKIEGAKSDVLEASSNLLSGEYEKVVELQPKGVEMVDPILVDSLSLAYIGQGNELYKLSLTKSGIEADKLFKQASEKYDAALKIKPTSHDALYNWGVAAFAQAKTKSDAEADELFKQAIEKYDAALKIKPDMMDSYYNWGVTLSTWARTKSGTEANDLFSQAIEKYREVVKFQPDNVNALVSWSNALIYQYRCVSPAQGQINLNKAKEILSIVESKVVGRGAYNLACIASLEGKDSECQKWLVKGKESSHLPDRNYLEKDADLDPVRDKEWFKEFIKILS